MSFLLMKYRVFGHERNLPFGKTNGNVLTFNNKISWKHHELGFVRTLTQLKWHVSIPSYKIYAYNYSKITLNSIQISLWLRVYVKQIINQWVWAIERYKRSTAAWILHQIDPSWTQTFEQAWWYETFKSSHYPTTNPSDWLRCLAYWMGKRNGFDRTFLSTTFLRKILSA